ncbi:cytochrome b N-terminal domain-containing protein [Patescibacteria group bacterium]|nr:cytochrome b N-terminal domain-containing protein [Patescibacteria group bacterium]
MALWNDLREKFFLIDVPSYGNSIFYSLGFLALVSLTLLVVTGIVMVFFGPAWWLTTGWGIFFRSMHLWSAQAFIFLIFLHLLTVFLTSGFKAPRRLTWMLGGFALFLVLIEAEFGYDLRGDFSSQYRALQGADLYNGAHLGWFINTLNQAQVYGLHIIDIPLILLAAVFFHYTLVKIRGLAKPYRSDVSYRMVKADHIKLFARGGVLAALIVLFAVLYPSPLLEPATIQGVANDNPALMGQTLMAEFTRTSDTATYFDSIDPYAYDTREVYIAIPYAKYQSLTGSGNALQAFAALSPAAQQQAIEQATAYYTATDTPAALSQGPVISVMDALIAMAKSGLYQTTVDGENPAIQPTYSLRFLADTGVLDTEAAQLHMTTDQWGMLREEHGAVPPGAWWLAPIGFLNHTVLANDPNGDRDGAAILGLLVLLLVVFPYIPYLNRLPEKLHIAEWIWRR